MNTNKTILLIVLACVLIAGGIYLYAYTKRDTISPTTTSTQTGANAKVAASTVADGSYTVQIHSITTTPEDTSLTFRNVEYFEGAEASSTAAEDVTCEKQPLAACVPTLTKDYYVRDADTPDFTVPLTARTQIALRDEANATTDMLRNLKRQFDPVFDIEVKDGVVTLLTEKSPL